MKIRTGFVSNSSSSSFVISVPKKKKLDKIKLEIEVDINKYISDILKTEEDIDRYMEGYYGSSYKEDDPDTYQEYLEEVKNGNEILIGSFSDDTGDPIEEFLCGHGIYGIIPKDIKVLRGEGGY